MTFQEIFIRTIRPLENDLKGKTVLDLPAGRGMTSMHLKNLGCEVFPMDLVPEFFEVRDLKCEPCDLNDKIPKPDSFADYVITQEGIEHISDQVHAFKEFSRVLKKDGRLLLTCPNGSSLKSRFSHFIGECEKSSKIMPPNLFDSIWFNSGDSKKIYFGHLFVPTISKLRVLAEVNGFELEKVFFSHLKFSNLVLFVLFYPFIFFSQWLNYLKNSKKRPLVKEEYKKAFYLSIHPKILLDGSLVVLFRKIKEPDQSVRDLNERWSKWQRNIP